MTVRNAMTLPGSDVHPVRTFLSTAAKRRALTGVGLAAKVILALAAAPLLADCAAHAQNGYVWKNVAISGSKCWVTGVAVHPTSGDVYIRTDVAGLFRWDIVNTKWIPLSNKFTFAQNNSYSVESFALDPTNSQIVYMACGAYSGAFGNAWLRGEVYRSTNKGATWTRLSPGLNAYMGGNDKRRWGGERLAISPASPNILLFGSRREGLWRSTDSGANWSQIGATQGIPEGTDGYGVTSVVFDSNYFGNTAGLVYASVEGEGVYVSRDHGATWSKTGGTGGPTDVRRLAITRWHVLWATAGSGVSRFMGGEWNTFYPNGTSGFGAIAIKPSFNANNVDQDILVSDEMGFRFDDPNGTGHLYRTSNNGASWELIPASRQTNIPWYQSSTTKTTTYQPSVAEVINVSALAYNPANLESVWAADWSGISRTDNLGSGAVFKAQESGHEEAVIATLAAPPSGNELFSGFLDIDSFRHENGLLSLPTKRMGTTPNSPAIQQTTSINYQEAFPSNMVRTGSEGFGGSNSRVTISTNNGIDWYTSTNFPTGRIPFRSVIAPNNGSNTASNKMNIVVMCKRPAEGSTENPWLYTQNGGANWYTCEGLPASAAMGNYGVYGTGNPLVADGSWGNAFFAYDASTGKFYSTNSGGATFSPVTTTLDGVSRALPKTADGVRSYLLRSLPGAHGDLWLGTSLDGGATHVTTRSTYHEGLWRSTNSGASWTRLPNVASVIQFAFGKPMSGNVKTLFLYGRLNGDTRDYIYRSKDMGATWTNITDPNNAAGNTPMWMEGSRQTAGRVFIGTNGSGIFFGDGP